MIPLPETVQSIHRVFESGRRYTLTAKRMPGFLVYDEDSRQACLRVRPPSISEADIVSAIERRGRTRYGITISFSGEGGWGPGYDAAYMTSREYELDAMYRTILKEGGSGAASSGLAGGRTSGDRHLLIAQSQLLPRLGQRENAGLGRNQGDGYVMSRLLITDY